MKTRDAVDLDLNIARGRLVLAPATLVSIYLDSATPDLSPWFAPTGGLLAIDRYAFVTLLLHLVYSLAVHFFATLRPPGDRFVTLTAAIDVVFAIVVAGFTEGATSPSFAFFTFAMIAVGSRQGFRATLLVTLLSTLAYLSLILLSARGSLHEYLMRPIYLAITGYLIGFLGEQRKNFEARLRALEMRQERHAIARLLHDGYVQALAGVNLRLSGCRQLLANGKVEAALGQLTDLQAGVTREYDEVRSYIRSLVELDDRGGSAEPATETVFDVQTRFRASGPHAEQILLILLEGIRNTMQHAGARTAEIRAEKNGDELRISMSDDGIGFADETVPPWSISSRVAELGGELKFVERSRSGAHLQIQLPG